ncbi:MAG: hypothetical protein IJU98_12170, partial [Synergistaceae bacterium]|nr:hypothetical protein [Synergistaceae bacterium]
MIIMVSGLRSQVSGLRSQVSGRILAFKAFVLAVFLLAPLAPVGGFAVPAWATATSIINVDGTEYTLFTGFTATGGNGTNYTKLVDGNTATDWHATKSFNNGDPNAPAGYFNGGTDDPAYVEFHADDPIVPKGYVLTYDNSVNENWKPTSWAL